MMANPSVIPWCWWKRDRRTPFLRATRAGLARALAFGVFLLFLSLPAQAMKIQKVTSPGGITAWLVEDRTVPLIALRFAFAGGASQDPADKPGVANFLSGMLDEGAGDMSARAFQEKLDELAIRLDFDVSRDHFIGSFQTLTRNREAAVSLLRLALTKPRFDADAVARIRGQILSGLKFDATDPDKQASRAWFRLAFGDHVYGRPVRGTQESVARITADDLRAYMAKTFAKANLTIAVVGDIDAKTLGDILDEIFGTLPAEPKLTPVPEAPPLLGPKEKLVTLAVPQSVATFGFQGIKRKDPDFIPAYVLNYILGGGGFSSRLMEEVREKRGLAYSVYSYLYPLEHSALFLGGVATKNAAIQKSLAVIRQVLTDLKENGPTEAELEDAKRYLTGSYALRFDSSDKIANQLLWIQVEKLGIDYVDRRNGLIEAVTLADVRKVAKRLLRPEALIVTIAGNPQGLGKPETRPAP